jgi:hypothetical protein
MNTCEKIPTTDDPNGRESALTEIKDAVAFIAPALLARFVTDQARVCHQEEGYLLDSLRRYLGDLTSTESSDALTVGDVWSGLLWWRDEASWIGRTGVLSLAEVRAMAINALQRYIAMRDEGKSNDEIASLTFSRRPIPRLAMKLASELTTNGGAPGFRAIVSYAVCNLGAIEGL